MTEDMRALLAEEIDRQGGLNEHVERVHQRESDPYAVSDELLDPIAECLEEREN